ncbi:MAG: 4Fe-4S binding protein [Candidatus Eisenbacteria bacterium]|nr:4Fe-4S binding protein [Candidatus Eisenbacteria bacterium]
MNFFDVWLLPRVWVGAAFCVVGLLFLMKSWVSSTVRLVSLVVTFFAFGVVLILPLGHFARGMSIHPSPVCIVTRPFEFLNAGRHVPVIFLSILAFVAVFTILGNKLFCGWVCPVGAAQEIVHRIPLPKRLKIKLPFGVTNAVRFLLYVVFLVVVFTAGLSIYGYFNPFEFLFWEFQPLALPVFLAILSFLATLIAALFIFRPFCYLICPLGLVTWILEHLSVVRVRVDKEKCTNCNLCVALSPCPAVPSILEDRKSRPDCHACGRCIEVCPEKALAFRAGR